MHQIFFWRFLRHIGTFLDHLGGVGTHAGRVPVPRNWADVEQIHGGVGRSVSQLLLGPHAPSISVEVPETHRNISRPLWRC